MQMPRKFYKALGDELKGNLRKGERNVLYQRDTVFNYIS